MTSASASDSRIGSSIDPSTRSLMKAGLAAAAPAVVALAALISSSAPGLLNTFGLGRLGVAALGLLAAGLGWLLWRGRWWAGIPTLAMALGAALFFGYKFARPLNLLLGANPDMGPGDLFQTIVMLSPSLVLVVLATGLTVAVYKGIRLAKGLGPRPVGMLAWGVLALWVVVLAGDAWFQQTGWQSMGSSEDMVVRLCSENPQTQALAKDKLLDRGAEAVPALLAGMSSSDSGLACLRSGAEEVLAAMGTTAMAPLIDAAGQGSLAAVQALAGLGDRRAAGPLLNIYRSAGPDRDPLFQLELKEAIKKLNPTLSLEG